MRSEKYPNSGPIYTFFFIPPPLFPITHYSVWGGKVENGGYGMT